MIDLSLSSDSSDASGQQEDGLSFYNLYSSPVFYNADSDGFRERTAWVGPTEGIVVFDKDNDGNADQTEIALTKVVAGAKTNMEALWIGFDKGWVNSLGDRVGKDDHKISWQEADAQGLKIWRDGDMDGKIDAGEMVSFKVAGVSVIDLNNSNIDAIKSDDPSLGGNEIVEQRFADGSVIFGTASVTLTNGKKTTAYDMGFAHEKEGMRLAA